MAQAIDFRKKKFDLKGVRKSGIYAGRRWYAKLYLIENSLRVIIHSVLSAQIAPNWWSSAVSQPIKDEVERFKKQYAARPWHTLPGSHDIYFTHLRHLNEIIRANRNHFDPIIRDVDGWMTEIERIRFPRNIVGHMNYPSTVDQKRIDVFYSDCQALVKMIAGASVVALQIPR